MSTERCDHGQTAEHCADCLEATRELAAQLGTILPPADTTPVIGTPAIARFAQDCACCGFRYPEGTEIIYMDDGGVVLGWVATAHLTPPTERPKHHLLCDPGWCHPQCPIGVPRRAPQHT